jgi:Fic family protein
MSKTDVQRLLGKMILDKGFKAALREKPEQIISQLGINLSDDEKRFVELFVHETRGANLSKRALTENGKQGTEDGFPTSDIRISSDALLLKIVQQRLNITPDTICQIHEAIFTPDTLGEPGKFREKPVYLRDVDVANCRVKVDAISNRLPSSEEVPFLLRSFCQWLNAELRKNQEYPILLAATAKHKFVCIHPFADGNGRVGRALVNLILAWFNLPKSVLLDSKREEYYEALKLADEGNLKMLREFIEAGMFASFSSLPL